MRTGLLLAAAFLVVDDDVDVDEPLEPHAETVSAPASTATTAPALTRCRPLRESVYTCLLLLVSGRGPAQCLICTFDIGCVKCARRAGRQAASRRARLSSAARRRRPRRAPSARPRRATAACRTPPRARGTS